MSDLLLSEVPCPWSGGCWLLGILRLRESWSLFTCLGVESSPWTAAVKDGLLCHCFSGRGSYWQRWQKGVWVPACVYMAPRDLGVSWGAAVGHR